MIPQDFSNDPTNKFLNFHLKKIYFIKTKNERNKITSVENRKRI
jgi:hypothetical protein